MLKHVETLVSNLTSVIAEPAEVEALESGPGLLCSLKTIRSLLESVDICR